MPKVKELIEEAGDAAEEAVSSQATSKSFF